MPWRLSARRIPDWKGTLLEGVRAYLAAAREALAVADLEGQEESAEAVSVVEGLVVAAEVWVAAAGIFEVSIRVSPMEQSSGWAATLHSTRNLSACGDSRRNNQPRERIVSGSHSSAHRIFRDLQSPATRTRCF